MIAWNQLVTEEAFADLGRAYKQATGFTLALISEGEIRMGSVALTDIDSLSPHRYRLMMEESVRWGEPYINMLENGAFLWCVPLNFNNEIVGGFFSANRTALVQRNGAQKIREAAWALMDLCVDYNFVNNGMMRLNRMVAQTASKKAEAIHQSKHIFYQNPRDLFLIEEREILNAIRGRNLEKAREIINRILVGVYHVGGADFEVLKLLILEMVVQMYRAAVSEGAEPEALLGVNSAYLSEFLKVTTEDELTHWLLRWLDLFINSSFATGEGSYQHSLSPAILYIKRNLDKPISRDQVARVCHLSPSYFSHLIKEGTGYTYSELLNRFRIDHACSLLERSSLSASEIAYSSGFNDQSYFTKVFRKIKGMPPGQYRARNGRRDEPAPVS
jgi:AraC-like DNA-binding protein